MAWHGPIRAPINVPRSMYCSVLCTYCTFICVCGIFVTTVIILKFSRRAYTNIVYTFTRIYTPYIPTQIYIHAHTLWHTIIRVNICLSKAKTKHDNHIMAGPIMIYAKAYAIIPIFLLMHYLTAVVAIYSILKNILLHYNMYDIYRRVYVAGAKYK